MVGEPLRETSVIVYTSRRTTESSNVIPFRRRVNGTVEIPRLGQADDPPYRHLRTNLHGQAFVDWISRLANYYPKPRF